MKTFVFQGDSITDAGRDYHSDDNRGAGYPTLVAARLGYDHPGEYRFLNRGVSGDRVVDLNARIKRGILNLKPDVLSILIGINDVWHELDDSPNGVDNDKYYRTYCDLLAEIKAACPDVRIYILEPFVLKASATEANWEYFQRETRLRAESAKKAAAQYGCRFLPLQDKFNALCEQAEPAYWLRDGVHPTAMGHQLIADELIKAVEADRA